MTYTMDDFRITERADGRWIAKELVIRHPGPTVDPVEFGMSFDSREHAVAYIREAYEIPDQP